MIAEQKLRPSRKNGLRNKNSILLAVSNATVKTIFLITTIPEGRVLVVSKRAILHVAIHVSGTLNLIMDMIMKGKVEHISKYLFTFSNHAQPRPHFHTLSGYQFCKFHFIKAEKIEHRQTQDQKNKNTWK